MLVNGVKQTFDRLFLLDKTTTDIIKFFKRTLFSIKRQFQQKARLFALLIYNALK